MRYMGAISLVLAALFGVGLFTGGHANAATSVAPPPVVAPPGGATLTQQPDGTWATSVYLDSGALCKDSFDLVTGAPDTDQSAKPVTYVTTSASTGKSTSAATAPCGPGQPAITEVELTFPAMPNGAIPQTATLAVTPSPTALAAGAAPVEFALTVRRELTGASSLWWTVGFGGGFALVLIGLVWLSGMKRKWTPLPPPRGYWKERLIAPSRQWTFGGSWVANFAALGTALGAVLTATGTISGIVPGVDLGRIGLLFAIAGASVLLAPLVFAAVNGFFESGGPPVQRTGGKVTTRRWIMVVASCFTAFGFGAEFGLIGWVLGAHLVAAPKGVHDTVLFFTFVLAGLFIWLASRSIHEMKAQIEKIAPPDSGTAADLVPTAEVTSSS
jgi:hypothetical protein